MPETNESRVDVQVGSRHVDGRPYHFSSLTQEDRIRKVFGISDETPLPRVREDTLAAYFEYLIEHLALPFEALYCQGGGEMRQLVHYLRVTGLIDPHQTYGRKLHGLFCTAQNHKEVLEVSLAEFGVREDNPNCQLIDDYAYWFVNCR